MDMYFALLGFQFGGISFFTANRASNTEPSLLSLS